MKPTSIGLAFKMINETVTQAALEKFSNQFPCFHNQWSGKELSDSRLNCYNPPILSYWVNIHEYIDNSLIEKSKLENQC